MWLMCCVLEASLLLGSPWPNRCDLAKPCCSCGLRVCITRAVEGLAKKKGKGGGHGRNAEGQRKRASRVRLGRGVMERVGVLCGGCGRRLFGGAVTWRDRQAGVSGYGVKSAAMRNELA